MEATVSFAPTPKDTWRSTVVLKLGVIVGAPGANVSENSATSVMGILSMLSGENSVQLTVVLQFAQLTPGATEHCQPTKVDLFGCVEFATAPNPASLDDGSPAYPTNATPHSFWVPVAAVDTQPAGSRLELTVPGPCAYTPMTSCDASARTGDATSPSRHASTATTGIRSDIQDVL